jgi:hypothetical protein
MIDTELAGMGVGSVEDRLRFASQQSVCNAQRRSVFGLRISRIFDLQRHDIDRFFYMTVVLPVELSSATLKPHEYIAPSLTGTGVGPL